MVQRQLELSVMSWSFEKSFTFVATMVLNWFCPFVVKKNSLKKQTKFCIVLKPSKYTDVFYIVQIMQLLCFISTKAVKEALVLIKPL